MGAMLWFRGRDLRLTDQPAVAEAAAAATLIPVALEDPEDRETPFRKSFHAAALRRLDEALRSRGSRLLWLRGAAEQVLPECMARWHVDHVHTLARVEPSWRAIDAQLSRHLGSRYHVHIGDTLVPPHTVRTASGSPFSVFTPFARAFLRDVRVPQPEQAPKALPPLPEDVQLAALALPGLPGEEAWPSWEGTPEARVSAFVEARLQHYATGRNHLAGEGISRLSGDLRAGSLSIRQLWHTVVDHMGRGYDEDVRVYLQELLWREFAHHTLWDRPELVAEPFRATWRAFPWRIDPHAWDAWKHGLTGYPVVDAAARELLATGFVHNRARMIAASFLTKHLLLDWRLGEAHYRHFLVDGCAAANSLNWQWSAGCGVDAQPWFRIFNPETQGRTYDADGAYVRRWIPELRDVPDRWIHTPMAWGQPLDYPPPVVAHAFARERFLHTAKGHLG